MAPHLPIISPRASQLTNGKRQTDSLADEEGFGQGVKRLRTSYSPSEATHTGTVDWGSRLSEIGRKVNPPSLRAIATRYSSTSGVICLHGGFPSASAFPITQLSFSTADGTHVSIDDPVKLASMQQYSVAPLGYAPLQRWAADFTATQHRPPCETITAITTGSNCSLEFICQLLLNKGDSIVCEEFTYSHMIESNLNLHGFRTLPVRMDQTGMLPSSLHQLLAEARESDSVPRFLYTVPTGQNPTGSTVPLARKKEIYAICAEFDVVIIEDDAYYTLQYPRVPGGPQRGLSDLEPSYLSLDTDGRVLRLDSLAKALAPGLRLGWATGAPAIINKLVACIHGSALGPCATSQVIVSEMMEAWGQRGLEAHVTAMQTAYSRRAHVITSAAAEHLSDVATWREPQAGMFLWLALGAGVVDADDVMEDLCQAGVIVVPGRITHALGPTPPLPCPFVRMSFASASEDDLKEAMRRMGEVLREFAARKAAADTGSREGVAGVPQAVAAAVARGGQSPPPPASAVL